MRKAAGHSRYRTIARTGGLISRLGSRPGSTAGQNGKWAISGDLNHFRKRMLEGLPGGSADGHPRQCTYVNKHTGCRCKKFSVVWNEEVCKRPDPLRCSRHLGGASPVAILKKAVGNPHKRLPMFYSKVLTKSLREFVAECCEQEPHKQLALWEELALLRDKAALVVGLYGKMKEKFGDDPTPDQLTALMRVGDMMELALKAVAEMSMRQSTLLNAGKDKVTVFNIEYAVQQVVRIAHQAFGNSPEVVEFERMVRDNVKIAAGPEGTTLTPDQEALALDALVPSPPEE